MGFVERDIAADASSRARGLAIWSVESPYLETRAHGGCCLFVQCNIFYCNASNQGV
jgi:hypothetical protein